MTTTPDGRLSLARRIVEDCDHDEEKMARELKRWIDRCCGAEDRAQQAEEELYHAQTGTSSSHLFDTAFHDALKGGVVQNVKIAPPKTYVGRSAQHDAVVYIDGNETYLSTNIPNGLGNWNQDKGCFEVAGLELLNYVGGKRLYRLKSQDEEMAEEIKADCLYGIVPGTRYVTTSERRRDVHEQHKSNVPEHTVIVSFDGIEISLNDGSPHYAVWHTGMRGLVVSGRELKSRAGPHDTLFYEPSPGMLNEIIESNSLYIVRGGERYYTKSAKKDQEKIDNAPPKERPDVFYFIDGVSHNAANIEQARYDTYVGGYIVRVEHLPIAEDRVLLTKTDGKVVNLTAGRMLETIKPAAESEHAHKRKGKRVPKPPQIHQSGPVDTGPHRPHRWFKIDGLPVNAAMIEGSAYYSDTNLYRMIVSAIPVPEGKSLAWDQEPYRPLSPAAFVNVQQDNEFVTVPTPAEKTTE